MNKIKYYICLFVGLHLSLYGVYFSHLTDTLQTHSCFNYDLELRTLQGKTDDESVMICFHGSESNSGFIDVVCTYKEIKDHLVAFNFPGKTARGTVEELLPALYVIKRCVINGGMDRINLYGFSAGGGAVINVIAALNTNRFDEDLKRIGIREDDKKEILKAIEKGHIILDCPLKSIEEIIAFRGHGQQLDDYARRYQKNLLEPIDSLKDFNGLSLNILVHFQIRDEALSNRDDDLFIQRLRTYNKGNTYPIIGNDGGHISYHASLWKGYPEFLSQIQQGE